MKFSMLAFDLRKVTKRAALERANLRLVKPSVNDLIFPPHNTDATT